jgi:UDP-N-acetyl-D-glucosamine dehydrogenase
MPEYVVRKVARALNEDERSVKGSHVLILGIAYKRDIDDMRESPALDVMRLLEDRGARVDYHDPFVASFRENGHHKSGVPLSRDVLERVDAVVIITDHSGVDYQLVTDHARLVVDTRNATSRLKPSRARIVPLSALRSAGRA